MVSDDICPGCGKGLLRPERCCESPEEYAARHAREEAGALGCYLLMAVLIVPTVLLLWKS